VVAYSEQPRPASEQVAQRSRKPERAAPHARARLARAPERRPRWAYPELDCVRNRLAPRTLAAIEARAAALGLGADQVALTAGIVSEEQYLGALARSLRVALAPLDTLPRRLCPLDENGLIDAAAMGVLPLVAEDGSGLWVIAPRAWTVRRLMALLRRFPTLRRRIRLASSADLTRFALRHGAGAIAYRAADAFRQRHPMLSAGSHGNRPARCWCAGFAALAVAGMLIAPAAVIVAAQLAMSVAFLSWTALRVLGALRAPAPPVRQVRLRDDLLPVYSVVVALYREAAAVPDLVRALEQLDYPPERLDIRLVLEADDADTWQALDRMQLGAQFTRMPAPRAGPRTKPKALNAALPFVRGAYTVVYDAEDRPEPDQLRRALNAFLDQPDDLACVQAALTIDNTDDGWLPRLFTAEYAGQFDVLLPALAAWRLPIPLGGSSNHFDTAILRAAGGWDAFNVTEDADLGTRLARLGFRVATLDSSTYEEAPVEVGAWVRQRTRWFKGWMQTWCVHMRDPRRLACELGIAGFISFQIVLAGTVFAALVQPIAVVLALATLLTGPIIAGGGNAALMGMAGWLHGLALIGGYAASALLALVGLRRRKLLSSAWALLFLPVHWVLLSVAAWAALRDLVRDPFRWEKTEHGGARSSRRAQACAGWTSAK
jgi:cellulose synthase/poly-beta-1,6-N-acetylglucosamine synthase-like glycosyltransferase